MQSQRNADFYFNMWVTDLDKVFQSQFVEWSDHNKLLFMASL